MSWIREEGKINENVYLFDSFLFAQKQSMACYLVKGSKKIALIDASGKQEGKTIAKKIKQLNLEPDFLILTHSHWDHADGTLNIKKIFPNIEVLVSRIGVQTLKNAEEFNKGFSDFAPKSKPITDVSPLKDEDIIDLGDIELKIFETPGHTNCSLSVLDQKNKILFTGDSFGYPMSEKLFIAPIMPPEFSKENLLNSIKKISTVNFDSICIAHFGCLRDEFARDFLDQAEKKLNFWLDFLLTRYKQNPSKDYIVAEIMKYLNQIGLTGVQVEILSNMFGDWLIKGLQTAGLI
ncbi:MAG: MBL fold metallo-hydrolase [Candidatus Lokiarchaeota archaeon]|nr:MBL fold metallo-hydrolase [Candidatus Lokiarchaeota archaeon]